jgi:hypothetical protein
MKKIFSILLVSFTIWGCTNNTLTSITYVATQAVSPTQIQYLDKNGDLIDTEFKPNAEDDQWQYEFMANEGDILFLSGKYDDLQSSLKLLIKIDGKIYKQASTIADTNTFLVVSGTVPYK